MRLPDSSIYTVVCKKDLMFEDLTVELLKRDLASLYEMGFNPLLEPKSAL